jgi:plastocyanin
VLTQSSKVFLPLSGLALVLGVAYGVTTGDRDGVILLMGLVAVAAFAGVVVNLPRENLVEAPVAADAPAPQLRDVVPARPLRGGLWPVTAALALGLFFAGFVLGPGVTIASLVLGAATVVGWMTAISSDHTGREINLLPLGLPAVGLFAIFSLMFFMSRVLLAVPEQASTAIALLVAVLILASATLVTLRPNVSSRALVAILAVAGVALCGGGVAAAALGPRKVEKPENAPLGTIKVAAKGISFVEKEITLKADHPSEISFRNEDKGTLHNIAIFADAGFTRREFTGDVVMGPTKVDYRFLAPAAGTYYFRCDIHPNMQGKVVVEG